MLKGRLILLAVVAQAAAAFAGCGGGGHRPSADPPSVDAAAERPVVVPVAYARPTYQFLSETGLFSDLTAPTVAPDITAFEPTYKLWSDGADKRRWIRLPVDTQIDSSDMDHWVFPIGTKLWKEFSRDGVLLETRLIERYGEGPDDYWMGAFVWNGDLSDAVFAVNGQPDVAGTTHDVPSQKDCGVCHRGDVGRVLGFSAMQLSGTATGPTLATLSASGMLTQPADQAGYAAPGDADTAKALGYLHANCGHCHNKNGIAWRDTQMDLRLRVADHDPGTSTIYRSVVGKMIQYWRGGAITLRVAPGDPDASALLARMQSRGTDDQMPPLATEVVDPAGLELLRHWISSLAP